VLLLNDIQLDQGSVADDWILHEGYSGLMSSIDVTDRSDPVLEKTKVLHNNNQILHTTMANFTN
jgi:hypothetical protein